MFGLGLPELMVVLVIVMVLFGAKRLPELASGLGKAIKDFKKASTGLDEIDVTPKNSSVNDKGPAEAGKSDIAST